MKNKDEDWVDQEFFKKQMLLTRDAEIQEAFSWQKFKKTTKNYSPKSESIGNFPKIRLMNK